MNDTDIKTEHKDKNLIYLEKIELPEVQKDKKKDKKKIKKVIITVFLSLIAFVIVIAAVFGFKFYSEYEGKQALPSPELVYPEYPTSHEEIILSFKDLLNDTKNFGGVKLDIDFDVRIIDESVGISGDSTGIVSSSVEQIKSSVLSLFSTEYDSQRYKGRYGDDFSSVLFSTQYLAHSVNIRSEISGTDENTLMYIFDYNEDTVTVSAGEIVFRRLFDISSDAAAIASVKDKSASADKNISYSYKDFIMTANVDRINGELTSVQQKRVLEVIMPVSLIGEYDPTGSVYIKFDIELYKTFSFTRVHFSLNDNECYIKKGSSGEIGYEIVSDQPPQDISVKFTSSDSSVLSVTGGTFKAHSVSDKPVTITAAYTYNGITYEDTCLYYVCIPVRGVKVTEKEITLRAGETALIGADISPEKATVKTVYWFTDNEAVATVDDSGYVTAVTSGTAEIYCITLDGNYKSVCTVTVR